MQRSALETAPRAGRAGGSGIGSDRCNHPANELLPWYLNGSLDSAESGQVRVHLDHCLICAEELSELASVSAHLEARREVGPSPPSAPPMARARWSFRMGVAAMLVLSALMGGYWIYRRL